MSVLQDPSASIQKWIRHSPYCLMRAIWEVMPKRVSRGVEREAWKGKRPVPQGTIHNDLHGQSHWGPPGDNKDRDSELSHLKNEKAGAFTHHLPFTVGWWLLLGTLIPGYLQSAEVVGRCTKKPSQNGECQWMWVGHRQHLLHLPTQSACKREGDINHHLWCSPNKVLKVPMKH